MKTPKKRPEMDDDPGQKFVRSEEYTDRGTAFEDDPYRQEPGFENEEEELFDDTEEKPTESDDADQE